MTTSVPVPALDRDLIGKLRADAIASRWSVEHLQTMLSAAALDALMRDSRLPALVELAEQEDPAATLTRFFILGVPERASALDRALPSLGALGLEALGLAAAIDEADAARALPRLCAKRAGAQEATARPAATVPAMIDPSGEAPGSWTG